MKVLIIHICTLDEIQCCIGFDSSHNISSESSHHITITASTVIAGATTVANIEAATSVLTASTASTHVNKIGIGEENGKDSEEVV